MDNFLRSINFIMDELEQAGGGTLKGDLGGRTIWGIAEKWHKKEVEAMSKMSLKDSREYAKLIYRRDYWEKAHCDMLDWPACFVIMDYAVQSDPLEAYAQWHVYGSWRGVLCFRVRKYLNLAKTMPQFFNGWMNRMDKVLTYATKED